MGSFWYSVIVMVVLMSFGHQNLHVEYEFGFAETIVRFSTMPYNGSGFDPGVGVIPCYPLHNALFTTDGSDDTGCQESSDCQRISANCCCSNGRWCATTEDITDPSDVYNCGSCL